MNKNEKKNIKSIYKVLSKTKTKIKKKKKKIRAIFQYILFLNFKINL